MKEQDIKAKLQQSADAIEVRDFSEVWADIEGKVVSACPKRRMPKWATALLSSVAAIALISAITLPIVLQGETVYLFDELNTKTVEVDEFFLRLNSSEVKCVDLTRYQASSTTIYQTEDEVVKGGKVDLKDSQDAPTFMMTLKFYDSSVQLENLDVVYDTSYTSSNGAVVEYVLKTAMPDYNYYVYDMQASYRSVNYYMEYTCFTEDVTPFLDSFFE